MTTDRFDDLRLLYARMDQAWDDVADGYGFRCNGCEDNCCQSLFFHHTQVEKSYLQHGFDTLDDTLQQSVLKRAGHYLEITFDQPENIRSKKMMCPLNNDGLCLLYPYRPMICRLHGLPHELCRPGFPPVKGPGCHAGNFTEKQYLAFDRTPFYKEMARIEIDFQKATGKRGKLKETIAHMLLS